MVKKNISKIKVLIVALVVALILIFSMMAFLNPTENVELLNQDIQTSGLVNSGDDGDGSLTFIESDSFLLMNDVDGNDVPEQKSVFKKIISLFSKNSENSLTGAAVVGGGQGNGSEGDQPAGGELSVLGEESCGLLNQDYTFNESFTRSGDCFIVNTDNIVIDGLNQFNITGDGTGVAINVSNFDNITIKNLYISNFNIAIMLGAANNTNISFVNVTLGNFGIRSEGVTINSSVEHMWAGDLNNKGIFVEEIGSSNFSVYHSEFFDSQFGLEIGIPNSTIENVTAYGHSSQGINLLGGADEVFVIGSTVYNNGGEGLQGNTVSLIKIYDTTITNDTLALSQVDGGEIEDLVITNGSIIMQSNSENNQFVNITIIGNGSSVFDDRTPVGMKNDMKFENSNGKISFFNASNLTVYSDLLLGESHYLEQNNVGFEMNSSFEYLNESVIQIELKNLSFVSTPELYKNGVRCDNDQNLCNTSYNSGTGILSADISGFSNYTASRTAWNSTNMDGMVVYSELDKDNVTYRLWNDSTKEFGPAQEDTLNIGTDTSFVKIISSHEEDLYILGTLSVDGNVRTQFNRDGYWQELQTITGTAYSNINYKRFDIAHEGVSGDAIIVYEDQITSSNQIFSYRVWNGSGFGAEQNFTANFTSSKINGVKLIPRSGTDEMMLLVATDIPELYGIIWNGTDFDLLTSFNSSTFRHIGTFSRYFDFDWNGDDNTTGTLIHGVTGDWEFNYTEYKRDTGLTSNVHNTYFGGQVRNLIGCQDPSSGYMGVTSTDNQGDTLVAMWNGTDLLSSPPSGDVDTDTSGASSFRIDCSWVNSTTAIFTYADHTAQIDAGSFGYFTFDKSTDSWSVGNMNSREVYGAAKASPALRHHEDPLSNQVMMTVRDNNQDVYMVIYNETGFFNISSFPLDDALEPLTVEDEAAYFVWNNYDPLPEVTGVLPFNGDYNQSDVVNITANVTDNTQLSSVTVDITLPNTTVETGVMTLSEGITYSYEFSQTDLVGDYSFVINARDNSAFENINNSEQGNFTVSGSGAVACGTITQSTTLTGNLTSNGNCFVINANNIILDGNGYTIIGNGSGEGVIVNNKDNFSIVNINLVNFSVGVNTSIFSNGSVDNLTINVSGIGFTGPSNISNSTIETNGSTSSDRALTLGLGTIVGNTFTSSNPDYALSIGFGSNLSHNIITNLVGGGITLGGASTYYNVFLNNTIETNGTGIITGSDGNYTSNNITSLSSVGFPINQIGDNNNFENNNFWGENFSVYLGPGGLNTFIGNNLTSNSSSVISGNLFVNGTFINDSLTKLSSTANEIEFPSMASGGDLYLLNVSFDKNNLSLGGSVGNITVQWFLDVNVSNSTGDPISGSTVNVYNFSNVSLHSAASGANGLITTQIVTEGIYVNTGWNYHTPHVVEVIEGGSAYNQVANQTINLTLLESTSLVFTLTNETNCGDTLTSDFTFTENLESNGTCFFVETDDITIDLAGFNLTGNGSGSAIIQGNSTNLVIKDGSVGGFNDSFVARNVTYLNITNVTVINSSNYGLFFDEVNHSTIERVQLQSLAYGLNLSNSFNNSIYNNIVNSSTLTIADDGNNTYNTSYACSDSYQNVLGRNCSGGNFWVDYSGLDDGSGAAHPNNISDDGIGDTSLPYTKSLAQDYLPLMFCSPVWSCGDWSTCSNSVQTRTCTDSNVCGILNGKPSTSQSCTVAAGGGGGSAATDAAATEEAAEEVAEEEAAAEEVALLPEPEQIAKILEPGAVTYAPTEEGQIIGPINAELPPPELILSPEEVKEKLVIGFIESEPVQAVTPTVDKGTSRDVDAPADNGEKRDVSEKFVEEKKAAAVVDNSYDARRVAELPREKITLSLANTDSEKSIVLKPVATQDVEDVKPVITRKVYEGAVGEESALKVSPVAVSSEMLSASLGAIDRIVIPPGSSESVQLEVSGGFGTSESVPVTVSFYAGDNGKSGEDAVYSQELELKREVVTTSSVVPHEDENSIDLFAVIIERERTDSSVLDTFAESVESNGLTGAVAGIPEDVVESFDPYSGLAVYDGQYLEVSLKDISENEFENMAGKYSFIGAMIFGLDSQVVFTEVYGPYDISSNLEGAESDQQGFVFAQKFAYDPEILSSGKYMVEMTISDDRGKLSEQSFLLDLDEEKDIQESIKEEISEGKVEADDVRFNGKVNLDGIVSDSNIDSDSGNLITGAVSYSDIVSVSYEKTQGFAYLIYNNSLPNKNAKMVFVLLLFLVAVGLIVFVFGPIRPILIDTLTGVKEQFEEFGKDLNA